VNKESTEILNTVTHLVGAVLAGFGAAALITLAALARDPWKVVAFSIYGVSLVLLYLASTLYHALSGRAKQIFKRFDHMAIFLLIAGSYTPFTLVTIRGGWGWALFAGIWTLAIAGITAQAVLGDRSTVFSFVMYLVMGWAAIVAVGPLSAVLPPMALGLIATGGILYTLGFIIMAVNALPYSHEIWHFFVLGASACHFLVMLLYVL